jgi:hypothetical protein
MALITNPKYSSWENQLKEVTYEALAPHLVRDIVDLAWRFAGPPPAPTPPFNIHFTGSRQTTPTYRVCFECLDRIPWIDAVLYMSRGDVTFCQRCIVVCPESGLALVCGPGHFDAAKAPITVEGWIYKRV